MPDGQAIGAFSHISWGKESTWGTPVARTKSAELAGSGWTGGHRGVEEFGQGFRGISRRRHYLGKSHVDAEFSIEAYYEGLEELFRQIFNTTSPTTGPTDTTVFTHTFTLLNTSGDPWPLQNGLSLEVEKDIQAFLAEGAVLARMTLTHEIDQIVMLTFGVIGEAETEVTMTAPTFPPEKPVLHSQGVFNVDDTPIDITQFEVTIDLNLNDDRRKYGSSLIKKPTRNGFMSVTGRVRADYENQTLHQWYTQRQEKKLNIIHTGEDIAGSGGPTKESLDLEIPRAVATGEPISVPGEGKLEVEIPFEGLLKIGSPDEGPAKLTLLNSVSTI